MSRYGQRTRLTGGSEANSINKWYGSGFSTWVDVNAGRGIFGAIGGNNYGTATGMSYITIATTGNATSFGTMTGRGETGACGSATRGCFYGGDTVGNNSMTATIEYVTIATTGNAASFGSLVAAKRSAASGGNATRGMFSGGRLSGNTNTDTVEYITIATTGNGTTFGVQAAGAVSGYNGGLASATRFIDAGGGYSDQIQYFTIATTGNGTSFGSLLMARSVRCAGSSSSTRGIFASGEANATANTRIEYITIATTGNSTSFGTQTSSQYTTAVSSKARAVIGLGYPNAGLEYITIATTGNSTSFGNQYLSTDWGWASCSNNHGGI